MLRAICELNLGAGEIDLGRLTTGWMKEPAGGRIKDYANRELKPLVELAKVTPKPPQDLVLYGFGRIGRLLTRALIEQAGGIYSLRLRAVVVRPGKGQDSTADLVKRAGLLRRDSLHGAFRGTIRVDADSQSLVVNGNQVKFIFAAEPSSINYRTTASTTP